MRKLTWVEYKEANNKNKELLESLVKRVLKTPSKSVYYSYIHLAEKHLKEEGFYKITEEVILKEKTEDIIIIYPYDDELEKKEMLNLIKDDVIEIDKLNIIFKSELKVPYLELNNILSEVLTSNEAAELYGITEGALRSAMKTGKLQLGNDYRKAGRITLITKEAMEREYKK